MGDVTRLLDRWNDGDPEALKALVAQVYAELRRIAGSLLRDERADHTLQPTALVHEAYMRLIGVREMRIENRRHFYGAAATAMRRILVDHARARNAAKRSSGQRVDLESNHLAIPPQNGDVEALDEALQQLAVEQPHLAELVQLRHFGGLTLDQCAEVLGVSSRTADTWWAYARAWLAVELKEN